MLSTSLLTLASALLVPRTVLAAPEPGANIVTWNGDRYSCKCYEGERCWPSQAQWKQLNATVGGNLRAVIPDPAVCYNTFEGKPTYDKAACESVKENFRNELWHSGREVSTQWPQWSNNTCLPTDNPNDTCTIGFFPEYVIMAKKKEHVKAGVDFARNNNIRLVIRNTGHDFLGRSTGYGSLAINTHNFKDVQFHKKWTGPGTWRGSAVTVGSGIQSFELLAQAHALKPPQVVVAGGCGTVGFSGGFIQGGGHGPLATRYGMAAEQALSFDLVTADGRYVTANAASNSDLFWALKGGGPSTFGTLISTTVKTYEDKPSAGVILDINSTHTTDADLFWKGYGIFHGLVNHYVDNGLTAYYDLTPGRLHVRPIIGPNMSQTQLLKILQPLFDKLKAEKVPFSYYSREYPTFYDLFTKMFETEDAGQNFLMAGRVFTRRDITQHGDAIVKAKRAIAEHAYMIGNIVGPGVGIPVSDTAIHPGWRQGTSLTFVVMPVAMNLTWNEKVDAEAFLTKEITMPLRTASPYGLAYVNEGNVAEPDWQNSFWGANYPKLKQIKNKWDPKNVFYARSTPGTDDWHIIDFGRKLCKKL